MTGHRQPIRVVFFGTPTFAVPTLERLAAESAYEVVLAVTQPARQAGRGRGMTQPAVRIAADRLGLSTLQPETIADAAVRRRLAECNADVFVVAAFGRILGKGVLRLPVHGCLNLHASILPKYRGASPVAAAILNGDADTGVSLMVMEPGLDTGPVVAERRCSIGPDETRGALTARLALLAADLAVSQIAHFSRGLATAVPQPEVGATIVRQLTKADGWIDWSADASAIARRTRAMLPWPRSWTTMPSGETLQILEAKAWNDGLNRPFGRVALEGRSVLVGCGGGALELLVVQLPGGRPLIAREAVAGRRLTADAELGATGAPAKPPPFERRVDQNV